MAISKNYQFLKVINLFLALKIRIFEIYQKIIFFFLTISSIFFEFNSINDNILWFSDISSEKNQRKIKINASSSHFDLPFSLNTRFARERFLFFPKMSTLFLCIFPLTIFVPPLINEVISDLLLLGDTD